MDAKELAARLRVGREILRGDVERSGGKRLVDRNVDAAEPGAVHPNVRDEIAAAISHSDVHGLADLRSLLFRGGDHSTGIFESNHTYPPRGASPQKTRPCSGSGHRARWSRKLI